MGMKFLLDTHIIVWLIREPSRISHTAMTLLEDPAFERYFSPVSLYEIAQKTRLGKMDFPDFPELWETWREEMMLTELPLNSRHLLKAGLLEWEHRDPFDRMLVAQAMTENLTLVTVDKNILALPLLGAMNAT